jgi:hypothetical protein
MSPSAFHNDIYAKFMQTMRSRQIPGKRLQGFDVQHLLSEAVADLRQQEQSITAWSDADLKKLAQTINHDKRHTLRRNHMKRCNKKATFPAATRNDKHPESITLVLLLKVHHS